MNKKISIPVIPIVIAIIAVIVVVIVLLNKGTGDGTSKLSKLYEKMVENQTYVFTRYDFEEKNKLITYRKVDKTLIDMYNSGEHISTLVAEGDTYLILHKNKEYYVYPNNNLDEETLTNNLKNIIDLEYTTGKEKIYGKTYKYEEYDGVSDFLISSPRDMDTNSIKTRFYFKGNELVYLKTIYDVVNEETGEKIPVEELQTVKVEYEVDESVFNIPTDYAES